MLKFCKDCKSYQPPIISDKCFCDARCTSGSGGKGTFDPVTGNEYTFSGNPHILRAEGEPCGPEANWFEPATLDGRLAMLDGDKP